MLENGWKFAKPGGQVPEEDFPNATEDKLFGSQYIKEVYFKADPSESLCICLTKHKHRWLIPIHFV